MVVVSKMLASMEMQSKHAKMEILEYSPIASCRKHRRPFNLNKRDVMIVSL